MLLILSNNITQGMKFPEWARNAVIDKAALKQEVRTIDPGLSLSSGTRLMYEPP